MNFGRNSTNILNCVPHSIAWKSDGRIPSSGSDAGASSHSGAGNTFREGVAINETGITAAVELSYLQLPILAKVIVPTPPTSPVTPHFFAGPNFGFEVSCNLTREDGGVSVSAGCDESGVESKGFDFGLSNIDDTTGSSDTVRNRTSGSGSSALFGVAHSAWK